MPEDVPYDTRESSRSRSLWKLNKELCDSEDANALRQYIYWPNGGRNQPNSHQWALALLQEAVIPPPVNYLPVIAVDDLSIACVEDNGETLFNSPVRRWHLGDIDMRFQDTLLDTTLSEYLKSINEELNDRPRGMRSIDRIAKTYLAEFVEKGARPRSNDIRPIQLACQNVIIGYAAVQYDQAFDGLRVHDYLTCEVPHLATHEANRSMMALILCDAFQSGGTMEIRFGGRNTPTGIPPSLSRFARTISVPIGVEDPNCITPAEARKLFTAVTPIPDDLRLRLDDLIDRGEINPERVCYILMADKWSAIEFDYITATSGRLNSIMRGGAPFEQRIARQAELETCRASAMIGMLLRCFKNADSARPSSVRVVEDQSVEMLWTISEEHGAVAFTADREFKLPWQLFHCNQPCNSVNALICLPRGLPTKSDEATALELQIQFPDTLVALLVPADMEGFVSSETPTIVCPERLQELDIGIEQRLAPLRTGRL